MSFAASFWSPGYRDGATALFDKLAQGVVENGEVLALAAARADMEEAYGTRLGEIPASFSPKKTGFGRDDGASMRRAYDGVLEEMNREGGHHLQVAENIRAMVIGPFARWADEHRQRVEYSRTTVNKLLRQYDRELAEVHRSQKRYFNKCRLLEDFRDEETAQPAAGANGDDSTADVSGEVIASPGPDNASSEPKSKGTDEPHAQATSEELVLDGVVRGAQAAQTLVASMLTKIPQASVRIPILGTYDNVSRGSAITEWILANMDEATTVARAETIGQDLVNAGLLRLIGQVGSKFANSSVMAYQWRPRAYEFAGISHGQPSGFDTLLSSSLGETLSETWSEYVGTRNAPHDNKAGDRLAREVRELDQKYRKNVGILDNVRTKLEESLHDHFKFMERCELDRLKALKAVMLDFLAALSNVVPSIQASVDKLLLYQETVNPANDLRYIIESYRTGSFYPHVTVYDNYYNSAEGSIFGMDLELRSRGDRKHVPYMVSTTLKYLDQVYPKLENDEVRLGVWTVNVPLKSTHALRREINASPSGHFDPKVFTQFEPPVAVSVLLLYFLELPDSIIPSQYYDILKAIYTKHSGAASVEARLAAVQNTFAQFRVANIATLDALTAHLKRLTTIARASDTDLDKIAKEVGPCLLQPKVQSALTVTDAFPAQLLKDLLSDRDNLFRVLKMVTAAPARDELPVRRDSIEDRLSRITQQLAKQRVRSDSAVPKQAAGSDRPVERTSSAGAVVDRLVPPRDETPSPASEYESV